MIFDAGFFKGAVVEVAVYQNKRIRRGRFNIVNDLTQLLGSWFGKVAVGNLYCIVGTTQITRMTARGLLSGRETMTIRLVLVSVD